MTDQIAEVVDRYGKLRWVKCHIIEAKEEKYFCLHNKSLIPCPIQILHAFCLFFVCLFLLDFLLLLLLSQKLAYVIIPL